MQLEINDDNANTGVRKQVLQCPLRKMKRKVPPVKVFGSHFWIRRFRKLQGMLERIVRKPGVIASGITQKCWDLQQRLEGKMCRRVFAEKREKYGPSYSIDKLWPPAPSTIVSNPKTSFIN